MKNSYASGQICYLRIPEESDVNSNWYQWFSDSQVTKYLVDRFWPNSQAEQLDFVQKLARNRAHLVLLICDSVSDVAVGVCSLSAINWSHRYADWAIVLPNSSKADPRVALEASSLILNVAFNKLNLLNIRTFTVSTNSLSIKLQDFLGFKQVGEFENIYTIDGKPCNLVCMQLNVDNWKKNRTLT